MKTPFRYQLNTSSFAYYWQEGIGRELLGKLGTVPDLENARDRIPSLFQVDEAADDLVEALHMKLGFGTAQGIIDEYLSGSPQGESQQKDLLDQFFSAFEIEPTWLDWGLIDKGLQLTHRSGISGLVVLRDYCLMGGYESAAINKPLIYTGALRKGAVKRISETVDFWVDVTGSGALKFGNTGFKSVLKTRMIHSYARLSILKYSDWDEEKWGMPLNYWDMLATNLGFSIVYLVGLRRMGIKPQADEIRGVLHLWKYIGYLLGIPSELMPDSEESAIEELYYWTMTQAPGDEDSVALAHALQEEPVEAYYPTTRWGRLFMREIHLFYNRYLLGDHSCRALKLDNTKTGSLAYASVLKNKWQNRSRLSEKNRQRLIRSGRAEHEEVKAIYLKWNGKK